MLRLHAHLLAKFLALIPLVRQEYWWPNVAHHVATVCVTRYTDNLFSFMRGPLFLILNYSQADDTSGLGSCFLD
jgi:hypothetical protein